VLRELNLKLQLLFLLSKEALDKNIPLGQLVGKDFSYLYREHLAIEEQYELLMRRLAANDPVGVAQASRGAVWALNIQVKDSFVLLMRFVLRQPAILDKLAGAVTTLAPDNVEDELSKQWVVLAEAFKDFTRFSQFRLHRAQQLMGPQGPQGIPRTMTFEEDVDALEKVCMGLVSQFQSLKRDHRRLKKDRVAARENEKLVCLGLQNEISDCQSGIEKYRHSVVEEVKGLKKDLKSRLAEEKSCASSQLAALSSSQDEVQAALAAEEDFLRKRLRVQTAETQNIIAQYDKLMLAHSKHFKQQQQLIHQDQTLLQELLEQLEAEQVERKAHDRNLKRLRRIEMLLQRGKDRAACKIQKAYRALLDRTANRRRLGLYNGWEAYNLAYGTLKGKT